MSIESWSLASLASVIAQPENPSNQSFGGPAPANPAATGATTQGATPGTTGTAVPGPQQPSPSLGPMLWLPILLLGFIIFTTWRQNKNEKRKQQELSSSMSKGDEVRTIGGEIGKIYDVRDNEVVLQFEEGRVRYAKTAIVAILKSKNSASTTIETKAAQALPAKA